MNVTFKYQKELQLTILSNIVSMPPKLLDESFELL